MAVMGLTATAAARLSVVHSGEMDNACFSGIFPGFGRPLQSAGRNDRLRDLAADQPGQMERKRNKILKCMQEFMAWGRK